MKQFFITDSFLPDKGGSREYYYQICKHLCIPVLTQKHPNSAIFDQNQNFNIIRKPGIRPNYTGKWQPQNRWLNFIFNFVPPLLWLSFWTFIHTVKIRPKINHAGGFQFAGFAALLMKYLFKTPFIVYAHGEEILANKDAALLGKHLRLVYNNADRIIANSEYTKKLLLNIGVLHQKISIVNPGISRRFFNAPKSINNIKNQYSLSNRKILLSVGRLTKRKGHDKVLSALPVLTRIFPDLLYVIAGDGPEKEALIYLTKKAKLANHVLFTGEVEDQIINALYWSCDVFIIANRDLPKDVEGFGMVFLEAGAAQKPVIGGGSGGAVEAIQDQVTGFLINPEHPHEIVECIQDLLNQPDLAANMGNKGRQWAESFLWTKQIRNISSVVNLCENTEAINTKSTNLA